MGKKASLKVNLGYYLDGDDEDYWDDDNDRLSQARRPVRREQAVSKPASCRTSHQTTIYGIKQRRGTTKNFESSRKLHLYYRRPDGRPFQTLILDHVHDCVLQYMAAFWTIREISAVSCVNQRLHQIFANPLMYAQNSPLLLPCMKDCPLPPLSDPQLARSLALEASMLFQKPSNGSREISLRQLQHISDCGRLVESRLSRSGSHMVCLLEDGSLQQYPVASQFSATRSTQQILPNDCLGILASCMTQSYCAILSMPSTGIRRYIVSVGSVDIRRSTWHQDLVLPPADGISLVGSSSHGLQIKMDGERLMVVVKNHLWVLSLGTGEILWNHSIVPPGWHAWTTHKTYVIAMSEGKGKNELRVYCMQRKCLVAQGSVHATSKRQQQDSHNVAISSISPFVKVFSDRIWFVYRRQVYSTGCIFRRLDRQWEKNVHFGINRAVPEQALRIKQLNPVATLNSSQPLLCDHGNLLYLADGSLIKIFTSSQFDDLGFECWRPSHVLCAEGTVTSLQADRTKVVCTISTEKKQRVEIFWHPRLTLTGCTTVGVNHSVCIKNAEVFWNRQELQQVDFQRGRLLVASSRTSQAYPYYTTHLTATARQGQLRVFSLIKEK